ncbi:MAG: NADH-quinone oxidoreductase subunit F [Deltaproteobacteria bacterium]|nr:NADH-quinone oxidoreductase subunit F [Deltaproteobacteria bacterium]
MINPIYIVAIGLGTAFSLGLLRKLGKEFSFWVTIFALGAMAFISGHWLSAFLSHQITSTVITTAGGKAPFVIVFNMGMTEALFSFMVTMGAVFSGFYLHDRLIESGPSAMAVLLAGTMGLNGIILTGDIFNLFVFMEISAIATAGLVLLVSDFKALQAGFKFMLASGIISGLLLLGIIFLYNSTGTLNISELHSKAGVILKSGGVATYLITIALLLELKPFPANGWGVDLYEGAPSGVSAFIASSSATAAFFVFLKVLPLGGDISLRIAAAAGISTFVFSNLMALSYKNTSRLLGYSSIGQLGLLVGIAGLSKHLGDKTLMIILTLLGTHYLAKAGLFWLSGIVKNPNTDEWRSLRKSPVLFAFFGVFIFALLGFPPFPSFFGKWELIMGLVATKMYWWAGAILLGTMFEGIYLFRWFSRALKLQNNDTATPAVTIYSILPVVFFGFFLFYAGYYTSTFVPALRVMCLAPLLFILLLGLLDFLPAFLKNIISLAGVTAYIVYLWPHIQGNTFKIVFAGIFLGGAILALIAGFYRRGKHMGFYPMTMLMFLGLGILVDASNLLELFYGWELMTIGSYFLLIRGERSLPHGLSYLLFSLGGSLAMLFGFALAHASSGSVDLSALNHIRIMPALAYSLMLAGFMTKTASLGLHIWLPGAHGEAVADIHFMASAILLKAGVFGIILVLGGMGNTQPYAQKILFVLGWIGALTALIGNIGAAFQESAKYLLAWSSIGQLGYIVFGLASMTHLGWLAAYGYTITHFLYKGILFLLIGGVAFRVGTADMYKMGGLIKRMPFSFFAVLIAIITLAGIPPLVGFTGKWLVYNMILSKHLFYQGVVIIISGVIAFLYLFRLIHVIFLGQLKDRNRKVKEVYVWLLIPAYLMLTAIFALSMFPDMMLARLGRMLTPSFPEGALVWDGFTASSRYGTFNLQIIMAVIGATFAAVFLWLVFANRKAQKVKQFNIFYSGEAPSRPELTHYGYNFFAHYRKAVGFMATPLVTRFWDQLSQGLHGLSSYGRAIYTGNAQSYLYHIVAFVVVVYLLSAGGIS